MTLLQTIFLFTFLLAPSGSLARGTSLEQLSPQVLFVRDLAQQLPFLSGACYTASTDAEVCANCSAILTCHNATNLIDSLYFASYFASPTAFSIPPIIGNLTTLTSITYWGQNMKQATIPTELGLLTALTELVLTGNKLNGTFPTELCNLKSLKVLTMQVNALTGTMPTEIGQLTSLQQLILFEVHFSGTIPTEIAKLSFLQVLDLSANRFTGTIPSELSAMSQLTYLSLSTNNLTGSVPPLPTTLTSLYVNYNTLDSQLPSSITANNWTFFSVNTNQFAGTIPELTINGFANFATNKFSGTIPNIVGSVASLDFSNNLFSDFSVDFLSDPALASALNYLNIAFNNLSTIPRRIVETNSSTPNNITQLYMNNNKISGTFPNYYFSPKLHLTEFSGNILEGLLIINIDCNYTPNPCPSSTEVLENPYRAFGAQNRFNSTIGTLVLNGLLYYIPPTTPNQAPQVNFNLGSQDVNECTLGTHACQQICSNGWFPVNSYTCSCSYGYTLAPNQLNCTLVTVNNNAMIIGLSVAIPIAFLILCASLLLGLYFYLRRPKTIVRQLPPEIAASYKEFEKKRGVWQFRGVVDSNDVKKGYYFKTLASDQELAKVHDLMRTYLGNSGAGPKIEIISAQQVYNLMLITSFINTWHTMTTRAQDSSAIFTKETWREDGTDQAKAHREFSYQHFQEKAQQFSWNREFKQHSRERAIGNILLTAHGTDLAVAEKIAQTGFASISSNDAGWYGRGIYFSSSGLYCFPYFALRKNPVLLLSWVLPGNIYPVIENHLGPDSIEGQSLKPGYNSHYVCTDRTGQVYEPSNEANDSVKFNEIVIIQESQVLPAYIVEIDRSNFMQLKDHYVREVKMVDIAPNATTVSSENETRAGPLVASGEAMITMEGGGASSHQSEKKKKSGSGSSWNFSQLRKKKLNADNQVEI